MKLPNTSDLFATRQASLVSIASIMLVAGILVATAAWILQPVYSPGSTGESRAEVVPNLTVTPYGLSASNTVLASAGDLADGIDTPRSYTPAPDPQSPLLGRRIGLDPGHGPRDDLGAVLEDPATGTLILSEAEFNLDVALRCQEILVARGASVLLTRENSDTFTTTPWPADANSDGSVGGAADDLQARIDIFNTFNAEVFLSIHANGGVREVAARRDIQVIYCGTSDCPFPTENKRLGKLVLDRLVSNLTGVASSWEGGQLLTDLEVDSSDPPLHMFILGPSNRPHHPRSIAMPGVLTESLYVTSSAHAAQLRRDEVRQAIALAYADALQDYLLGDKSGSAPAQP